MVEGCGNPLWFASGGIPQPTLMSPAYWKGITVILGGNGSVLVQFTDTPELFGGELRIFGAIDIVDGKIVRWVDYWDASSFDKALYQQIKTPADHFPYDYAEKVVGEHASPKIQDVAKRLNAALNSPNPGDAASSSRVMVCWRMRRSEYEFSARPPSAGTSAALRTTFPMGLAQSHGMSSATTKEAAWNGSRILKRACVLV